MPTILETQETDLSRNHAKSLSKINPGLGNVNAELIQPIQYFVGLYSVNKRRMADSNYAFIVENGAYKTVTIPTCPADQRYIKVLDIPHPVQAIEADPNAMGEVIVRVTPAKRVAMSIVHPDVIGESMDHLPPQSALAKVAISSNCDLIKQGVFFTTEEEGTQAFEKLLAAAEARVDAYYRQSLDGLLGMSDSDIRRVLASEKGLDLRQASIHFGEDIPGVRSRARMADCPNCSEKIPLGAGFHMSQAMKTICVIDWQKAVKAGVKTRADVPPEERWWNEDAEPSVPVAAAPPVPAKTAASKPAAKGSAKRR